MTRVELMIDDVVKQEADDLFASLGLDTATAIQIFLRASIAHAGIPFSVEQRDIPAHLRTAVHDSRTGENLHGPFATAEEAVASMLGE